MANPEPSKRKALERTEGGGPAIILVKPQLGENIGMAARAMMNCTLTDLRLVRPRGKWPNAKAISASVGAHPLLEKAGIFDSTEEAIADLQRVAATTARLRDMAKDVIDARGWASAARQGVAAGEEWGVLFGGERAGLHNDDLALADTLLTIPTNPAFSSLNLAQTVLLISYEWRMAGDIEVPKEIRRKGFGARLATQEELVGFYEHLEGELEAGGFLRVAEKRPRMIRNIRNIFNRARLNEQEVRTLRGVIVALAEKKWRRPENS
jgi:tRNA/rRNA methyltransferase